MPGLDGFGVLKKLVERKMKMPHVVFATAFDQYAVQAFDVNAVDYVLKPFDKARISKAIQRARKMLDTQTSTTERLEQLVSQLGAAKSAPQKVKVLVQSQQRLLLVNARRRDFRDVRRRLNFGCDARRGRLVELPHARGAERDARLGIVLAAAPLVSREHATHQGSRAVVQLHLHPKNERQKIHRSPRKPRPSQAPARTL